MLQALMDKIHKIMVDG